MKLKAIVLACSFLATPALAQGMNTQHGGMQHGEMQQGGMHMGGSPADQANMQAMQKMQDDMPKMGTGNPDKDFVTMMIPHHQGAIDMAKVELQFGTDPVLKKMAAKIVEDQEKEIREMTDWLKQHK